MLLMSKRRKVRLLTLSKIVVLILTFVVFFLLWHRWCDSVSIVPATEYQYRKQFTTCCNGWYVWWDWCRMSWTSFCFVVPVFFPKMNSGKCTPVRSCCKGLENAWTVQIFGLPRIWCQTNWTTNWNIPSNQHGQWDRIDCILGSAKCICVKYVSVVSIRSLNVGSKILHQWTNNSKIAHQQNNC